jgi:hypothetical protein
MGPNWHHFHWHDDPSAWCRPAQNADYLNVTQKKLSKEEEKDILSQFEFPRKSPSEIMSLEKIKDFSAFQFQHAILFIPPS